MDVHFSSQSNEWSTPREFFDRLNAEFNFTLDAAASVENALCDRFYTIDDDGLNQSWKGERVWCNPPYGREIGKWIAKAATEPSEVTVMLIPARTDTKAWHQHIFGKAEIRFVPGRLKFSGGGQKPEQLERPVSACSSDIPKRLNSAPFPSAVVIFRLNVTGDAGDCRDGLNS